MFWNIYRLFRRTVSGLTLPTWSICVTVLIIVEQILNKVKRYTSLSTQKERMCRGV